MPHDGEVELSSEVGGLVGFDWCHRSCLDLCIAVFQVVVPVEEMVTSVGGCSMVADP